MFLIVFLFLLLGSSHSDDLIQAVSRGDETAVKRLIESGADVNAVHPITRWTPLDIACYKGYGALVERLIAAGADVNATDKNGSTPLMKATAIPERSQDVIQQKAKIVGILVKAGADPNKSDHFGSNAWQQALASEIPALEDAFESAGVRGIRESKLLLAIATKDNPSIQELLKKGVDVNWKDTDGYNALSEAVLTHDAGILKTIVDYGADVDMQFQKGWTALMIATHQNQPELIRVLLTAGANRKIKNDAGLTAYDIAKQEGHIGLIALLQK